MDNYSFSNLMHPHLSLHDVMATIEQWIHHQPQEAYVLSVGTDSWTRYNETSFITAIQLHRRHKGAWGCLRKLHVPRSMTSLREKVSYETALSQEIASYFTDDYLLHLMELVAPYEKDGASFQFEIHLDIGQKGPTKELIQEMVGRIYAMGLVAKIKPEAYTAFSYANRYTR